MQTSSKASQREAQRRIAKQPRTLTAVQHAALRDQLKEVHFLKPDFPDSTKVNIAGMQRKWKKYVARAFSRR